MFYMHWHRMCVLLLVGAVFCKWQLGPVGYSCLHVFYVLTDFLFTDSVNYWEKSVEITTCNCGETLSFSFQFYQVLLHEFWSPIIRCINVWDCCVLLMNLPLCYYVAQLVKNLPAMQETWVRFLIGYPLQYSWASLVDQLVKNPPAMQETWVQSLGWEDPLEKGKATHYSILV